MGWDSGGPYLTEEIKYLFTVQINGDGWKKGYMFNTSTTQSSSFIHLSLPKLSPPVQSLSPSIILLYKKDAL